MRRYNSMRLLALSISLLWYELCVLAKLMAPVHTTFVALIAIGFFLLFSHRVPAQPSTAPPSSLETRALTPESTESELRGSCDLCQKSERWAGSDLRPQRRHGEKGLRPHKSPKGTHRSFEQSLKLTLPRRQLVPPEVREQRGAKQENQPSN
ncbi:MAG: hypothetical protein HOP22_14870 [Nitrospiraceae bacterium]|nr:hypothetical protein [Nitrospiraceae bacterium]